ncbi:MAG: YjfB family protein [Butyrivibrio sp.]|nr:YjfB family protein [Butyrivibrio sp.]
MDIAGLSTALSMSKTQTELGAAMISKNLEMMETLGDGMAEMIEATDPDRGVNLDVRV